MCYGSIEGHAKEISGGGAECAEWPSHPQTHVEKKKMFFLDMPFNFHVYILKEIYFF